jgi:hypothetical protein|uniref:RING-CH-type domain-containing protein n=1 Tax=viral metagenome TaxID=1070528 RepID=A0A6C0C0B3_9ZZZZ
MEILDISDNLDIKECRICFLTEEDDPNLEFISPCACSGTSKWVHIECLNRWRLESVNPTSMTRCSECRTEYRIIDNLINPEIFFYPRRFIYNFFYLINGLIIGLSMFIYLIEKSSNHSIINFLSFNADKNNTLTRDGNSLIYSIFYYDISSYFILNWFVGYFLFNFFKHINNKRLYIKKTLFPLINILAINQLIFPLLKLSIDARDIQIIVYIYTLSMGGLILSAKGILEYSNRVNRNINLLINNEIIIPYDNNVDGYDADSDTSEEIELFTLEEESETTLLTENYD